MNTTVWILIAFLGTSPWPGATAEHQIPEEYASRPACEKGRIALRVANPVYAENIAAKIKNSRPEDWHIDYSVCIPVPSYTKAGKK